MGKKKHPQPHGKPPFEAQLFMLGIGSEGESDVRGLINVATSACNLIQAVLQAKDPMATLAAHWLVSDVSTILRAAAALHDSRTVEISEVEIDAVDPTGQALKSLALLLIEHPDGCEQLEPAREARELIGQRLTKQLHSLIGSVGAPAEARA